MLCPRCQHDNDSKDKFCSQCGASLSEERKLEQLKEHSRQMASSSRPAHKQSPAAFTSGLITLTGWTAFIVGAACLLCGIAMLSQPSAEPPVTTLLQLEPMSIVGKHIPSNAEVWINSITAPDVMSWSLWSIFAGLMMMATGDVLKLLIERLPHE